MRPRRRRALSTLLTSLIAVPVHSMDCLTIFVASIEACTILPREFEIACFTCCNAPNMYSSIFEMRWPHGFHDIPGLEPIEDFGILGSADREPVFVVVLNLPASMSTSLDQQ